MANSSHYIDSKRRTYIEKALKERLSLRGITRVFGVSLTWLTAYAKSVWQQAPDDLGARPSMLEIDSLEELEDFGIQMDEVWSFVATKINKVWIWLAYAPWKRQVIAFHLGRRDTASAKALWNQIVVEWQEHCCFDTDDWNAYKKKCCPLNDITLARN